MGPQFFETPMGRKFLEGTIPKLVAAIEANTAEIKRANDLKEKELKQTELLFGLGVMNYGKPEPPPAK